MNRNRFATRRGTGPSLTALALAALLASPAASQTRWEDLAQRGWGFDSSAWQGSGWLDGSTGQTRQWRLGVTGDNGETGVVVRQVASNSSAARARIEPGDVIVNVSGFQVGIVEGRLYDLAEEINRRADTSGYVSLVVQDHVSGRLANVRVKLDEHQATLRGAVVYRERTPLPADAIVTVRIENVTRPHYSVRNGQTSFRPSAGSSFPFEIAYDSSYIDARDTYQLRAVVTSGGRTILDTPTPQRVLTGGAATGGSVQLLLAPVGQSTTAGGGVVSVGYPNYNDLDDRLIAMYRRYLRRDPTFVELAALRVTPNIATRIDTMPLDLMAGQEYFDAVGNNNGVWLGSVFQEIVKRQPSSSEQEQWMRRFADLRYSRTELLRQLYSQAQR